MKYLKNQLFIFITFIFITIYIISTCKCVYATNDESLMYKNSDFIEKEQPELTEETKKMISNYQKDQNMDNYLKLRDEVIKNYNAVLDRKEQKLAELIEETKGKANSDELVAEMQEIVQEMYITYWNRINSSMLRFTDSRLLNWKIADASNHEYIPVMGAGNSIYVKKTPVTNKEYAEFIKSTGYKAPTNWTNGTYPNGEDDYPVNYVSYTDAETYCKWLTTKDGKNTYRLPSESEWELAAGHMPKDADFNCGINNGRTPVNEYSDRTRGAHGAVDFWGNVWEWTSTQREDLNTLGVKGGSYKSARTDCRTEYREESRNKDQGYDDVGFRVILVLNGKEPEQKTDLYTLDAPSVSIKKENNNIILSWNKINNAVEYQIFEYNEETKLFKMIDRVTETYYTINNAPSDTKYIVQALSYTAISDNVSPDYINQEPNNIVTENNEENIKDSNNKYIYYTICAVGIVAVISVVILITTKNKKTIALIILVVGILLLSFGGYKIITYSNLKEKSSDIIEVKNNNQIANDEKEQDKANIKQDNENSLKFELKKLGDLQYYLYTPNNPTNDMPLIMYLHGATFKNLDISELLKDDGFPKYVNDGYYGDLRAYVVIPKLDNDTKNWIDISDSLEELIKEINSNYGIDLNKVALTGHSIGGTGTYQLQIKLPNTFACIAPMSGFIRNSDENISALSKTKIWAFVGTNDTVISPNSTKQAIRILKNKGIDAKLTEYQDADHFLVPVLGYKDSNFINWLVNCGK